MSYPPSPEQPEPYGSSPNPPGPYPGGQYGAGPNRDGQYQGGQYPDGQYQAGPYQGDPYQAGPQGQPYQAGPQGQPYQAGPQGEPYQAGPYQAGPNQAGQYPPPGQVPPGYQLARPGRPGLLVSAVLLGILAVAAIGIALALGHAATECSSDIGQLAQAFDQQAAGDCSAASTARTVLEIASPVFALGCIAMIIGYRRR